jgi:hypothetical protein
MSALPLREVNRRTRIYAAYSREASGLGNVLGAVLVFVSLAYSSRMPLPWWQRLVFAAVPFLWIAGKELLRSRYYQQFGEVTALSRLGGRAWALLIILFSAVVSLLGVLVSFTRQSSPSVPLLVVSLLASAAVPFVVHRYLRGKYEFIPGLYLIMNSLLMLGLDTAAVPVHLLKIPAAMVAFVMLFAGAEQHRKFLRLRQTMMSAPKEEVTP